MFCFPQLSRQGQAKLGSFLQLVIAARGGVEWGAMDEISDWNILNLIAADHAAEAPPPPKNPAQFSHKRRELLKQSMHQQESCGSKGKCSHSKSRQWPVEKSGGRFCMSFYQCHTFSCTVFLNFITVNIAYNTCRSLNV